MKRYFIITILAYLIFNPFISYALNATTGFIPGDIWYSTDNLIEGDTVKIYTAIWNGDSSTLNTKVEFYDKNVILGYRDVIVPSFEVKEVYVNWKITSGDHSISAKILSPLLEKNSTTLNYKFIPIVINNVNGNPATTSDILQSQIDKASSSITNIIPNTISVPLATNANSIDNFRANTLKNISETKLKTENKIKSLNKLSSGLNETTSSIIKNSNSGITIPDNQPFNAKILNTKLAIPKANNIENATERPIAYIKLFIFYILSFIFGNKIIFYSLIIIIIFLILRSIYYKIRNG